MYIYIYIYVYIYINVIHILYIKYIILYIYFCAFVGMDNKLYKMHGTYKRIINWKFVFSKYPAAV